MTGDSAHRRDWEALGGLDPLYAILSAEDARHGGWDIQEFLATGEHDIARLLETDRKSTRLNSSHIQKSRMPSSA